MSSSLSFFDHSHNLQSLTDKKHTTSRFITFEILKFYIAMLEISKLE